MSYYGHILIWRWFLFLKTFIVNLCYSKYEVNGYIHIWYVTYWLLFVTKVDILIEYIYMCMFWINNVYVMGMHSSVFHTCSMTSDHLHTMALLINMSKYNQDMNYSLSFISVCQTCVNVIISFQIMLNSVILLCHFSVMFHVTDF
jgi:hypothetical protein